MVKVINNKGDKIEAEQHCKERETVERKIGMILMIIIIMTGEGKGGCEDN
jgi:hypothetical protein